MENLYLHAGIYNEARIDAELEEFRRAEYSRKRLAMKKQGKTAARPVDLTGSDDDDETFSGEDESSIGSLVKQEMIAREESTPV